MSYHLAAWAMDVDVPPREKLMLILIASHANDEGECFPSQTTLAYRSGLSRGPSSGPWPSWKSAESLTADSAVARMGPVRRTRSG